MFRAPGGLGSGSGSHSCQIPPCTCLCSHGARFLGAGPPGTCAWVGGPLSPAQGASANCLDLAVVRRRLLFEKVISMPRPVLSNFYPNILSVVLPQLLPPLTLLPSPWVVEKESRKMFTLRKPTHFTPSRMESRRWAANGTGADLVPLQPRTREAGRAAAGQTSLRSPASLERATSLSQPTAAL